MIYFFIVVAVLVLVASLLAEKPAPPVSHYPVDPLRFPKVPVDFKGTPYDKKSRFIYEPLPFYQSIVPVLAWMPSHILAMMFNGGKKLEVQRPASNDFLFGQDCLIWLGHASYFIRMNGKNILIDPHFNSTGPYKRHTINPVDPSMFTHINYILLTHDHADHCDPLSLQQVIKQNPLSKVLTGKNMSGLVQSFTDQQPEILEALWYEKFPVEDLDITFIPSRHYSKRIFKPFNSTLWGGFVIASKQGTIFLSADSGYGPHFEQVGKLFNPDVTIIGTGAYQPAWFMKANHMSPEDAVKASKDTGASLMIPSHYGTFHLGNESVEDVESRLMKLRKDNNILDIQVGRIYPLEELFPSSNG